MIGSRCGIIGNQFEDTTGTGGPPVYECDGSVAVNQVVYLDDSGVLMPAQANDINTMPAAGYVASKLTSTTCILQNLFKATGLSGLTVGTRYYVSETVAGGIQSTLPTTVGHVVQTVGKGVSATELLITLEDTVVIRS